MEETTFWQHDLKAGIIQTRLHLGDTDKNLRGAVKLVRECIHEESPDLLVLPEVFSTGFPYNDLPILSEKSEEIIQTISDLSRDGSVDVIFTQVVNEDLKFFNRLYHIGSDGKVKNTYDKTHLFSRSGEDRFFTPGSSLKILDINNARAGPLICYEVRFPELSRRLVRAGANILIYPAQWPAFRTFQWEVLLQARAVENQCFVIGVNIYGDHGGSMMGGRSRIFSPFGNVLASVDEGPGWSTSILDPEKMHSLRNKIPVLDEIREDLDLME